MTATFRQDGDTAIITVEGRIDSNTNQEFLEKIQEGFNSCDNVTLDFTDVEYISSAALRSLLIGQKTSATKNGAFVLANVSDKVMKLLEAVGFTKILTFK